ncbi:ferritin-like domain-containing protein [Paracoccus sp. TK19116]|uniref:Ferritin-like domain-containing protein n=1 Tax=Paracoccus albicereus TaxID=2922394 RepID=A0ABT1MMJ4_9RHOB|nr:ferritin-like domain-containing protein [Paracoccus albicereus]MCQ0969508.1 ferritin-like domain-containing protein [Paracoccus albicereus]
MALMTIISSLDELYTHRLQDIYYAEKQIVKSLPKMIENARNDRLKSGLEKHLRETETHVERLEEVFSLHGEKAEAVECPAIDGIIEEADHLAGEVEEGDVLDAAIIASAQAVEHYEITRYGTLVAWAQELGHDDAASLLRQNLDDEYGADQTLNDLAQERINRRAG